MAKGILIRHSLEELIMFLHALKENFSENEGNKEFIPYVEDITSILESLDGISESKPLCVN